jgi:phospholipase C
MALQDIEHIVVLVLENRSFDHMLGYLGHEGYKGADGNLLNGLHHGLSNPLHVGGKVVGAPPFELTNPRFSPGPHHEYPHVAVQLGIPAGTPVGSVLQPTNEGFIRDYETVTHASLPEQIMGYYGKNTVSVYDALVRQYGVCDRWFSSVPGPTMPNRCFLMAGHSNEELGNIPTVGSALARPIVTIFDRLSEHNVSWKYYFHDVPVLRLFNQFTFTFGHIWNIKRFFSSVAASTVPSVSWIDPNLTLQGTKGLADAGNDDHPPTDVRKGQNLVASIYNALVANPALWAKTLFVVTYDEHGGFYDHVPPPAHIDRAPFDNPAFYRFGLRVPTLLLSPWIRKGTVWSEELEHTSIIRTILKRFCPQIADAPNMGARVQGAPDLAFALDAPAARTDCTPVQLIDLLELPPEHESHAPIDMKPLLHDMRLRALAGGVPADET